MRKPKTHIRYTSCQRPNLGLGLRARTDNVLSKSSKLRLRTILVSERERGRMRRAARGNSQFCNDDNIILINLIYFQGSHRDERTVCIENPGDARDSQMLLRRGVYECRDAIPS